MIPDLDFAYAAFRKFNRIMFGGGLKEPVIVITTAATFLGRYVVKTSPGGEVREEIRLSRSFSLSEQEWEDVVIHEMIHQWVRHTAYRRESPHGAAFRRKMWDINANYGRDIRISRKVKDSEKKETKGVVCIALFDNERVGVMKVPVSRLSYYWAKVTEMPGIQKWHWCVSASRALNSLPKVRSMRFYLMEEAWLKELCTNLTRLERRATGIYIGKPLKLLPDIVENLKNS